LVVKNELAIEAGRHAWEQRIASRRTTGSAKADRGRLCRRQIAGMSQSRRLAAILAADVVGYSRLMGADEEGTLERLKALRGDLIDPNIAKHHGRIVKTTGDGLLVEFASVVDAVRCATEVQQAMPERNTNVPVDRRIELRIGINLGDVIADGDDLYGDGVNVAARIEALADAGGVFVSGTVYEQVRDRRPFGFEDRGEQQVKNIARPIRVYRVLLDEVASTATGEALPLPAKPSIAVLPFANLSADQEQEYFSDGIADDIITELSRIRSLFVIARNSSFTYKGQSVPVKRIARDLGVRYIIEGSLRRSGNQVRIVAQLVDAEADNHIWAERYDRVLEDVFAVQDEITTAIVKAIAPAVADAELRRILRRPPRSLGAWEAYQRGLWHLGKGNTADKAQASEFLQRATELDASFAPAYSALGLAYVQESGTVGTRSFDELAKLAASWARKAIEIDPTDADAQAILSQATLIAGNLDDALQRARLARNSSPSSSLAFASEGFALVYTGLHSIGRDALREALRLDPHGHINAVIMQNVAAAYYLERAYDEAIEAARRTIMRYPDWPLTYRWLAAALGQAKRTEEAGAALQIAMSSQSFEFYTRQRPPWFNTADFEHLLDGLRKAGWQG
jgi:adenylate cyclase